MSTAAATTKYEVSVAGASTLMPRVHNSVSIITGLVCLLVGLLIGAGLVAIPVATMSYSISSAIKSDSVMIVKTQEVPHTEKNLHTPKSEVVKPLK